LSAFPSPTVDGKLRKSELVEDHRAVLPEGPLVLVVKEADRVSAH
jgi:hypothetical protein